MDIELSVRNTVLEIRYPEPGEVRARTVVSRSNSGRPVKRPSWKMGRMIECESRHERNAVVLLDVCPMVTAFYEQPLTVRYVMDGQEHIHYPDLLVKRAHCSELWEVKTEKESMQPEVRARTRILQQSLPERGYQYRIALAEDLAQEPRLENAKQLLKHGWTSVTSAQREYVCALLRAVPHISWSSVGLSDLGPGARAVLSRLVLDGVLQVDMNQPLTGLTQFSLRTLDVEIATLTDCQAGLRRVSGLST